jgi:hypothetical protein
MKTKTIVITVISVLMLSGILMTSAIAADPFPNLPPTPVTITQGPLTIYTYPFDSTLSGVPAGYDVANGVYVGWCVDLVGIVTRGGPGYEVMLYSSLTPPAEVASIPWDMINYIINNKQGTGTDVQEAIWYFVNGGAWPTLAELPGWPFATPPSAAASAMVADALANGVGFVPGPGELLAVICLPTDVTAQDTIIELTVPQLAPGFTPGFWKHDIEVRLSHSPYDEGLTKSSYNAFSGGPRDGEKLTDATMDSLLAIVNTMPGFETLTFDQALANLQLPGWNQLRTDTANAFNAAAGYGPY